MTSPVMAATSLGTTIVGGVLGAFGANNTAQGKIAQDQASAAMARYQSQVALNNQIVAQRNADYAIAAGQTRATANSMKTAQVLGQQKAQQAANGVDVNSGSPLDIRASTAELGQLDTLTILNEAANRAAGYKATAANFGAESDLDLIKASSYDTAAKYDKSSGEYAVAGSLISSASSFSDKWANYQQKGVFS